MFPKSIEKRYPLVRGKEITLSSFISTLELGSNEYYFDQACTALCPYAHTVEAVLTTSKHGTFKNYMQRLSYNIMMINTAYKHEEDFTKEIASSIYQAQNNELPLNISRLYILQYVMCIENC
jgi:hypothetical protein